MQTIARTLTVPSLNNNRLMRAYGANLEITTKLGWSLQLLTLYKLYGNGKITILLRC